MRFGPGSAWAETPDSTIAPRTRPRPHPHRPSRTGRPWTRIPGTPRPWSIAGCGGHLGDRTVGLVSGQRETPRFGPPRTRPVRLVENLGAPSPSGRQDDRRAAWWWRAGRETADRGHHLLDQCRRYAPGESAQPPRRWSRRSAWPRTRATTSPGRHAAGPAGPRDRARSPEGRRSPVMLRGRGVPR